MDILQFAGRVAAVSPQARNDEHQAKDQRALAAERQAERQVPIQHDLRRERPGDEADAARECEEPITTMNQATIWLPSIRMLESQFRLLRWRSVWIGRGRFASSWTEQILRRIESLRSSGNAPADDLFAAMPGRFSSRAKLRTRCLRRQSSLRNGRRGDRPRRCLFIERDAFVADVERGRCLLLRTGCWHREQTIRPLAACATPGVSCWQVLHHIVIFVVNPASGLAASGCRWRSVRE